MCTQVLAVQWNLAFDEHTAADIVEQALSGIVSVLGNVSWKVKYMCTLGLFNLYRLYVQVLPYSFH